MSLRLPIVVGSNVLGSEPDGFHVALLDELPDASLRLASSIYIDNIVEPGLQEAFH
jgi:hypothetical protein